MPSKARPSNAHILATISGLPDEVIVELWDEAQKEALTKLGDEHHPDFLHKAESMVTRAIEHKALEGVPAEQVPWVLFDIHMAMAVVKARNVMTAAKEQVSHLLHRHDDA